MPGESLNQVEGMQHIGYRYGKAWSDGKKRRKVGMVDDWSLSHRFVQIP